MANLADGSFRPYVSGEGKVGQPIRAGLGAAPYFNGLLGAATNFNHHLAYFRKPVVDQHGDATISFTPSTFTWANYVIRVPRLLCRGNLRFEVTANATVATELGLQPQGSAVTWAGAGFTGLVTTVLDVPVTTDEYIVVDVRYRSSLTGSVTITDVLAYLEPLSAGGVDIGTIESNDGQDQAHYTPQATSADSQYALDCPLTVAMIGDLLRGNDALFRDCAGAIVNWSYWGDRATVPTAAVGMSIVYDAANITAPRTFGQYIYVPREGVRKMRVFAAARTHDWTTPTVGGKITFGWRGASAVDAVEVATATTVFTEGTWVVWAGTIDVPQGQGPYYLDVRGMGSADGNLYVQALAVYEDVETVA